VQKLTSRGDISRNRYFGWAAGSSTSYGDLSAGNVPLRRAYDMKTDLFNADQVLYIDALSK
jgi:hypothetical protein